MKSVAEQRMTTDTLDAWVREVVAWHFDPETGCPFWLDFAKNLDWDPRKEIHTYEDLSRFGFFQDEWLRGGPVRRGVPKGFADRPVYTFETGGSTGVPKSRINIEDFRLDPAQQDHRAEHDKRDRDASHQIRRAQNQALLALVH